jgi:methyl acetate hydrolase
MTDIGFTLTPSMMERRATIHSRTQDSNITPQPDLILPQSPEMDMGGHGLYASIGEYMKFILMNWIFSYYTRKQEKEDMNDCSQT